MGTKTTFKLDLALRSRQKKKVRALRREGLIPGVIYGKDFENVHIQVGKKDFENIYRKTHGTSIIDALVDGKTLHVLIHEIQRDSLSQDILHVDFLKVDPSRDVSVEVPLIFTGTSPVEKQGTGKVGQEATSIHIKCAPGDIPSEIEVDISCLQDKHDVIHASDLDLPKDVSLAHGVSEEKVIATVVPARFVEAAAGEAEEEVEETPGESEEPEAPKSPEE